MMRIQKIAAGVMIAGLLTAGCTSAENKEQANVSASEIADAAVTLYEGDMQKVDADTIADLLHLEEKDVSDAAGYEGKSEPEDLIFVVEAVDESAASRINDSMNYYLSTLHNTASMYSPEQLEKISDAYLATNGTVSVLAISDEIDEVKKAVAVYLH